MKPALSAQDILEEAFEEVERAIKSISVVKNKKVGFCQHCQDVTAFRYLDNDGRRGMIECATCGCNFCLTPQKEYSFCGICRYFEDLDNPWVPKLAREKVKEYYKPHRQLKMLLSDLQDIVARKKYSLEELRQVKRN